MMEAIITEYADGPAYWWGLKDGTLLSVDDAYGNWWVKVEGRTMTVEEFNAPCSFCGHDQHFGDCGECDCPRDHIPLGQWDEWLRNRDALDSKTDTLPTE